MIQAEPLVIITQDQFKIHATRYNNGEKKQHLIIIASANGAPQGYYRAFAEHVSSVKYFDALTFDYRGIGKSLQTTVKKSSASLYDWGEKDLASIISWADEKYDKIFILGHSIAGQIFPLAENSDRIKASYFVASSSAYQGNWRGIHLLGLFLFWYILLPLSTYINGYMPGWVMGGNVSLPKHVALQWRAAGLHSNGIIGESRIRASRYAAIKSPVHFLSISDDKMHAPTGAVQALMRQYVKAKTTFQYIRPSDLELKKIGHFGFFKSKYQKKLWSMPLFYFTQYVESLEQ